MVAWKWLEMLGRGLLGLDGREFGRFERFEGQGMQFLSTVGAGTPITKSQKLCRGIGCCDGEASTGTGNKANE